jgi:acyl carrier protein
MLAINWSAWRDVGMAANLSVPNAKRAERAAFLRQAIDPQAGVKAFAELLASGRKRAVVTSFDLLKAANRPRKIVVDDHKPMPGVDAANSNLEMPAFAAPLSEVQKALAVVWSELLGVPQVGLDDDFFQLGGHSLLATRLLARINTRFGVRLALRDVFDTRTLGGVAERVTMVLAELQAGQEDQEEILI